MPCCGQKVGGTTVNWASLGGAIGCTVAFGAAVGAGVSLSSIMNPMLAIPGLCGMFLPALFPGLVSMSAGRLGGFLGGIFGSSGSWLWADIGALTASLGAAGVVWYIQGFGMEMGIGALGAALGWVLGTSIVQYLTSSS